jgi:hypothetical protein
MTTIAPLVLESAKNRYPDLFRITKLVISTLHIWIDKGNIPNPQSAIECVLHACSVRAYNLYRSINNLLETDHWEDAAILARSMFELLLNLEEIQREHELEDEKATKYFRFHYLQRFLHSSALEQYKVSSRGNPSDNKSLEELESHALAIFAEFRKKNEWQRSWCGKSVHALAKESGHPMRYHHYKIIYSFFSDMSHSGPLPVLSSVLLGEDAEELSKQLGNQSDNERKHATLVLSLSTVWLLEIILRSKKMIPKYQLAWNERVLRMLIKYYGNDPSLRVKREGK